MRIANEDMIPGLTGVAMASTITSEAIWLGHIANYSIQIVFTGSPVGSFKLQLSNDDGRPPQPTTVMRAYHVDNWTDITNSTQGISAAGNHSYTAENAGYRWVRLVWTPTSGSGTVTVCRMNVKGV